MVGRLCRKVRRSMRRYPALWTVVTYRAVSTKHAGGTVTVTPSDITWVADNGHSVTCSIGPFRGLLLERAIARLAARKILQTGFV